MSFSTVGREESVSVGPAEVIRTAGSVIEITYTPTNENRRALGQAKVTSIHRDSFLECGE